MDFIVSMIVATIGMFIFSFTGLVVLIILFFGIPATNKLNKLNLLKKNNGIIKRYIISIIILSTIFLSIAFAINAFSPSKYGAFIVGSVIALIFGISRIGKNKDNIQDYVNTNKKYLLTDEVEAMFHLMR